MKHKSKVKTKSSKEIVFFLKNRHFFERIVNIFLLKAIFIYIRTQKIFEKHTHRTKTAVTNQQLIPDVSDEEGKVYGRPILLLMLHIRRDKCVGGRFCS